jgi:hypothetical protein
MTNWWHDEMSQYAEQVSKGVLNEMKRRIMTSNIQKEKLQLNESTDRMKQFFQREIKRYSTRKDNMKKKAEETDEQLETYRKILRELVECNVCLANKCKKHNITIQKVRVHGNACSWR